MNTARVHLKILIQLARIDGVIVQEEIDLINTVGRANGLSTDEINVCFDNPFEVTLPEQLSDDTRFDLMYNIVQLMKIDGRIYEEEITYCARIASKLGYSESVLRDMMLKIYSSPENSINKESIKNTIIKHTKK